jgi:SSS family solute:Na+ symporter
MGFSAIDYIVLFAYLAGITAFGTRFRRSQRSVTDYFRGNRTTSWWVISLSIVATETSTLSLIGVPALVYASSARPELGGSLTYLQVVIGYLVGRLVISAILLPAYFRRDLLTAYALLERRFGSATKHFAASLFLVMRALAEGVRVFAASLVLGAVLATSFPHVAHLWLWSIVIVGLLTLIYTFEGGIGAVIWTDVIQFVIYIGGCLVAVYEVAHLTPGGWSGIVSIARGAGKLRLLSFSWRLDLPFTFWAGLVGGAFLTTASHGTDQLMVQRLLTCRSLRDSRKALLTSGVVVFLQFVLFLVVGLALFGFYQSTPAPVLTTSDEIFPTFIVQNLPHGVSGLVIAAIFAAAMSNLSGSLNSLASTTIIDFYQPLLAPRATDVRLLIVSRWCTAAWGVALIGVAVVARDWGSVFTAGLTIASLVYGPMLGAFLLGVLTIRATERGVMAGMAVSLACMLAVRFYTTLAWTWYVLVGTAICAAVGYLVSRRSEFQDERGGANRVSPPESRRRRVDVVQDVGRFQG